MTAPGTPVCAACGASLPWAVDESPQIAERYDVRGIPTLLHIDHGDEVGRQVGAVPKAVLERWLDTRTSTTA